MTQMLNNTHKQRGGMILGIIIGVLVGLAVALAVAMYVMKVPTPFNSKVTPRTPAQDASEAKKNKDWDPNAALSGKPAIKIAEEPSVLLKTAPTLQTGPAAPAAAAPAAATPAAAAPATPASSANAGASGIDYYVQVGAYRSETEANSMRAKLALAGFEGKIIEREQSGHMVYRVRVGPYPSTATGDKAKASLEAAGFETIVVRSQK
jgi:cell division protein FtsN